MALTEYCIIYSKTNQPDTTTGNNDVTISRSGFALSGDTTVKIGQITRIVFQHQHAAVGKGTWKLQGRLNFSEKATIASDTVAKSINGNYAVYNNTFTANLPTAEEWAGWTSVRMHVVSSGSGTLHWMATSARPMRIFVYFYKAEDLIVDADPPTVTGVTISDTNGYSATFGNAVQRVSNLLITGQYSLDSRYPDLSAQHTLILTDNTGATLYNATQANSAAFAVGAMSSAGTIAWTYIVTDSAGGTAQTNGTFTVLSYAPPSITNFVVERYETGVDDQGHTIYIASDDGEQVRFTFTAAATSVSNRNAWSLTLTYAQQGITNATTVQIATFADGTTDVHTKDRSILTAAISASSAWWFTVTARDAFGQTAAMTGYVDEAGAFFSVEPYGVAVGMRATGTAASPKFEVDEGYTSHFGGKVYLAKGVDMGWQPLTLSSGTGSLEIGRVGSHVYIRGEVTAASGATLAQLPSGFEPSAATQRMAACGGYRVARLSVSTAGALVIDFVCNLSDGAVYSSAVWVCCDMDYWID